MNTLEPYNTEDPLTLYLQTQGYQPQPDYWMETEVIVGMQVILSGAIIRYHWEAPTLIVQHYEVVERFAGLKNPFCGLFKLISLLIESPLEINYLAGKPLALSHSRLNHQRLWQFYAKMGVLVLPQWPGWIFLALPDNVHLSQVTPSVLTSINLEPPTER